MTDEQAKNVADKTAVFINENGERFVLTNLNIEQKFHGMRFIQSGDNELTVEVTSEVIIK